MNNCLNNILDTLHKVEVNTDPVFVSKLNGITAQLVPNDLSKEEKKAFLQDACKQVFPKHEGVDGSIVDWIIDQGYLPVMLGLRDNTMKVYFQPISAWKEMNIDMFDESLLPSEKVDSVDNRIFYANNLLAGSNKLGTTYNHVSRPVVSLSEIDAITEYIFKELSNEGHLLDKEQIKEALLLYVEVNEMLSHIVNTTYGSDFRNSLIKAGKQEFTGTQVIELLSMLYSQLTVLNLETNEGTSVSTLFVLTRLGSTNNNYLMLSAILKSFLNNQGYPQVSSEQIIELMKDPTFTAKFVKYCEAWKSNVTAVLEPYRD